MRNAIVGLLLFVAIPAFGKMHPPILRGGGSTGAAAGGSTFATDAFTRVSDGDLNGDTADTGGTWDDPCDGACSDFAIAVNAVVNNNSGDWNAYTVSATPPSAEYYSQGVVFTVLSSRTSMGPAVQILDNNNFIGCNWDGGAGDWNIVKYEGGTLSTVDDGEVTNPPTTARTVKLSRSGTTYTCTSDGTTVASGTDASFSNAEKAGIFSNFSDTDSTIDTLEAGQ